MDRVKLAAELVRMARELVAADFPKSFDDRRNVEKMERAFASWFRSNKGKKDLFDHLTTWVSRNMPSSETKGVHEDDVAEKEHEMAVYLVEKYGDEELKSQLP
jgi:hypothetical protein